MPEDGVPAPSERHHINVHEDGGLRPRAPVTLPIATRPGFASQPVCSRC